MAAAAEMVGIQGKKEIFLIMMMLSSARELKCHCSLHERFCGCGRLQEAVGLGQMLAFAVAVDGKACKEQRLSA